VRKPETAFEDVRAAASDLADVEETIYYGTPALKVRGRMFVCIASHRSAEPGTLVAVVGADTRDALIGESSDVYYVTDHYIGHPSVLVRLSRIGANALKDVVEAAYRYVLRHTRPASKNRAARRPARRRGVS
jgi:hypothetical protein